MSKTPGHNIQNLGLGVSLVDAFVPREAKLTTPDHLGSCGYNWTPKQMPWWTRAGPIIPQARTLPAKKEMAVLRPTKIPTPMKAGVHSTSQPQFSTLMAALLYLPQMKNQVNICQSHSIPVAYWDTTRSRMAPENAILRAFIFILAMASPVVAACILRMVMAVAEGDGKTRRSSRAT